MKFYRKVGKRWLDLVLTWPLLVALLPLLAVVALLVRIGLGSSVLFKQVRPGLDGRPFTIYKFRTMTDARDEDGNLLPDKDRLTRLGRWLRATSVDELPELLNVVSGQMSLVGPRPLLMEYLPLYNSRQRRRHQVLPGITGWAQVMGRNAIGWDEKFNFDIWYVENLSLGVDLRILFLTVKRILSRDGINQPGQATMSKFTGTVTGE